MRWICVISRVGPHCRSLLLAATATLFATGAEADKASGAAELLLAAIEINGLEYGVSLLARDSAGEFYADADDITEWQLTAPETTPLTLAGVEYLPLAAFDGLATELDTRSMRLVLSAPPELLQETRLSLARAADIPDGSNRIGAFLDYDFAYTDESLRSGGNLAGLLSPTLFTARGSLSSEWLYSEQTYALTSDPGWRRLDTTWTHDDPARARSVRVGDAITASSGWLRSVRFGGFQIASNFATRPAEITFPQPKIEGTATVPSVLDIYVNGQMRSQVEVQGGAFEVHDIPVVTGTGQVQVVVRDMLGREQLIVQDFYASERLLRSGLNEYSLSVGRMREDYGLASDGYGEKLVAASFRRGISDRLTLGGQTQMSETEQVAGASMALSVGSIGLTTASLARSSADSGGSLWQVGHQYHGQRFRVDVRIQGTSEHFTQPGVEDWHTFPERQTTISTGIGLRQHGSLGVSLVEERTHAGEKRRISSLSYSRTLPADFMLSFAFNKVDSIVGSTEVGVALTRSIGPRTSSSVSLSRRSDGNQTRYDQRYDLPSGPGIGYRASIESGVHDAADGEFLLNTGFAHYGIGYEARDGLNSRRLQTRGSIARFNKAWFATREISEGFALVDAGGYPDVRVYLENRAIGTTRSDGMLLVPRLRPYEQNQLRIESGDIPITARIANPAMSIVPYYRSGVLASFGVEESRSVMLQAVFADGQPVPEGARARVGNGPFDIPLGLNGAVFLQDFAQGDRVEVMVDGSRCELALPDMTAQPEFARLGTVQCITEQQSDE